MTRPADHDLVDLVARLDALEAEVRLLRVDPVAPGPPAVRPETVPPSLPEAGPVGRRRLLQTGLVAGAAAGAALLSGSPAAAAQNGNTILGQTNDAGGGTTEIDAAIGNGHPAVTVRNTANGPGTESYSANNIGIHGIGVGNTADGVWGTAGASGVGVYGNGYTGVHGIGALNGVYGEGANGVQGFADSGNGVVGETTSGTGVYGEATTGRGVVGSSNSGDATVGVASSGIGLRGESDTGIGGRLKTSGPGPQLLLVDNGSRPAPYLDATAHAAGEVLVDANRDLWTCVTAGTPGTWRKLSGPSAAGAFHALPTPVRVYDSRPGTSPSQGPKTALVANTARTIDLTVNSSHVPAGATAAVVNLLLVNATVGSGNFTVWANGAPRPQSNSMVWGGNAQRFSGLGVTSLDGAAKVQVLASLATDLVLDVVGYHR